MKYVKLGLRYLLGALFVMIGVLHFLKPGYFTDIMPDYFPLHYELVLFTGLTEILAGAMLFHPRTVRAGAWGMIAMLVIFLTVHIHMLVHAERYENIPLWILWLRLAMQFPFIAWAWWFTRTDKYHEGTPA